MAKNGSKFGGVQNSNRTKSWVASTTQKEQKIAASKTPLEVNSGGFQTYFCQLNDCVSVY